ncbi:MAG: amidohydrolase family protein [Candidatus Aminicenantales bacterium]
MIWAGTADDPEEGQPYDINFRTAALLARAGVLFSIEKIVGQPDGRNSPRNLPVPAALSVAHGLSEEDAIKALTIRPAQILGVDKDMGSLEAGKIGNVVVWSGSPLQMKSRVQAVIIGGRRIPLESRQTKLRDKFERIVRERRGK